MLASRLITLFIVFSMVFSGVLGCSSRAKAKFSGSEIEIAQIKNVVIKSAQLTADALQTGDTSNLSSTLRGQYLEETKNNVFTIFNSGYYGKIIAHESITFHEVSVEAGGMTAKVEYSYEGTLQLFSLATNRCERSLDNDPFGGIYFLEKIDGLWYLTVYQDDQSGPSASDWNSPCL